MQIRKGIFRSIIKLDALYKFVNLVIDNFKYLDSLYENMRFNKYFSVHSLLFFITIFYMSHVPGLIIDIGNYPEIGYKLFAIDQTTTLTITPSASLTQTEMVTETTLASVTNEATTQSPVLTSTTTETTQPTETLTALPSNTNTSIPSLTPTNTPDYTSTPEPTNTLIPLPSITLLFPIETVTPTQISTQISESSLATNSINSSDSGGTGRISAQSILLIGTIILLWAILAMFVIFYIRKIGE